MFWHDEHTFCMRGVWHTLKKQPREERNANDNRCDLSVPWPLALREGNPRSPIFPFGCSRDWQGRCPAQGNWCMICFQSPSYWLLPKWAWKSSPFTSSAENLRVRTWYIICFLAAIFPMKRLMINRVTLEIFIPLFNSKGLKCSSDRWLELQCLDEAKLSTT